MITYYICMYLPLYNLYRLLSDGCDRWLNHLTEKTSQECLYSHSSNWKAWMQIKMPLKKNNMFVHKCLSFNLYIYRIRNHIISLQRMYSHSSNWKAWSDIKMPVIITFLYINVSVLIYILIGLEIILINYKEYIIKHFYMIFIVCYI